MMSDLNGMSSDISPRKESNCVKCRNHGLKITLRGHKQYCPYSACSCDKCRFTNEQCRQMRLQNAIRRAEVQSGTPSRRQRNSSASAPTMVSPQQQVVQQVHIQHQQPTQEIRNQQQIIVTTVASNQTSDQKYAGNTQDTEEKKHLFDCSSELLKKFRYPWEMMPIMYALSKYANGNIEEILQKIEEGQFAVNEQLRLQTLNMYFGSQNTNTVPATRECG